MLSYNDLDIALINQLDGKVDAATIKSYGGEFSPDSFGQCPLRYPAVMVNVQGLDNSARGNLDKRTVKISVYAADRDLSGEAGARKGVYSLIEEVREALNRFGIDGAGVLVLESEALVGYSRKQQLCVMRATYQLSTQHNVTTC